DELAAKKMGIEAREIAAARDTIHRLPGDLVIMFGGEVSAAAQALIAQAPSGFGNNGPRALLHPLPLFNNSVGAHDLSGDAKALAEILGQAGDSIRAAYIAGSLLPAHDRDQLARLDFVVVQELFETATTAFADVVFPAASFAEVDGTFTNNGGLVQRVRQSIDPVHQSMADWMITARLAKELGVDFGFERSASAVFREIADRVPAYAGLRYPSLKDESRPVQVKHAMAPARDVSQTWQALRQSVEALPDEGEKSQATPAVGHELFKPGTLISKTPQIGLLAAGNPTPETFAISPLYQITVDDDLKREAIPA
ncbi:MAG TPA: molybdopterin-dependent oxidoreductase, partial [Pyrinomonadaceae bacterium]|nr:molybdopterin-dependent oxidoreductase [Pyrinomonadaceae bacterium]